MKLYNDFVSCAIQEDKRNKFGESHLAVNIPQSLASFYSKCNPVDVEVTYPDMGAVVFCPVTELPLLQNDYQLPADCFVFATCNGDPIFVSNGKVMTTIPEVFRPEVLATGLDDFLNIYVLSRRI